jgi:hypothetical protein
MQFFIKKQEIIDVETLYKRHCIRQLHGKNYLIGACTSLAVSIGIWPGNSTPYMIKLPKTFLNDKIIKKSKRNY